MWGEARSVLRLMFLSWNNVFGWGGFARGGLVFWGV